MLNVKNRIDMRPYAQRAGIEPAFVYFALTHSLLLEVEIRTTPRDLEAQREMIESLASYIQVHS